MEGRGSLFYNNQINLRIFFPKYAIGPPPSFATIMHGRVIIYSLARYVFVIFQAKYVFAWLTWNLYHTL